MLEFLKFIVVANPFLSILAIYGIALLLYRLHAKRKSVTISFNNDKFNEGYKWYMHRLTIGIYDEDFYNTLDNAKKPLSEYDQGAAQARKDHKLYTNTYSKHQRGS